MTPPRPADSDVLVVCASRYGSEEFYAKTLLGQSLRALPESMRPRCLLWSENTGPGREGLPALYNRSLGWSKPGDIVLFVHDDVYLHDPFLAHRLREGLLHYDVVGLAGSRDSDLEQASWCLAFDRETLAPRGWQSGERLRLSGAVSHLLGSRSTVERAPALTMAEYGPMPARCDLLDGLFLAMRVETVRQAGVLFDTRFDFHLYDLDFCRSATRAGLTLGTWPIAVTHGSGGNFDSPEWRAAARQYLDKWAASASPTPT